MPTPTIADFYSVVGWPVWIMLAGGLLSMVAGLWLVVAAFRESVLWGACVLLVPFAALVFIFKKWEAAARPFLLSLASIGLIALGFVLVSGKMKPDSPAMMALAEKYGIIGAGLVPNGTNGERGEGTAAALGLSLPEPTPARLLTPDEVAALQRELNESSASLLARKEALDPDDAEAKAQLTADIATYNERLKEFHQAREAMRRAGLPAKARANEGAAESQSAPATKQP